ncbi:MAG: ATP-binding protein [Methanoculleaceae archaeon]
MIQIAVISGKGGTGKTVVTGALSRLIPHSRVLADCDVDAANLSLLLHPQETLSEPFYGMKKAVIDPELCMGCGLCGEYCRFDAISMADDSVYSVDTGACEGCGLCEEVCPEDAIHSEGFRDGEIFYSQTACGPLSHAELAPGSGNSGLLVNSVKKQAIGRAGDREVLLIDGPPGIGCPVISTLSGVDMVVAVSEPSMSAIHDLKRLITVSRGFELERTCIINRYDLDEGLSAEIERFCKEEGITLLGKIPFDPAVLKAVRDGHVIVDIDCPASRAIEEIWQKLADKLKLLG